jgi:hypothetical protein
MCDTRSMVIDEIIDQISRMIFTNISFPDLDVGVEARRHILLHKESQTWRFTYFLA